MSRNKILARIRKNKPDDKAMPKIEFIGDLEGLFTAFQQIASSAKTEVIQLDSREDIAKLVASKFPTASVWVSQIPEVPGTLDIHRASTATELAEVDVAIIPGILGVAENGAIWISEHEVGRRILPFITQHLIIILEHEHLVPTMHEAYQQIHIDETGFGVFIAGPSKTADIAQSLVIGAHGPRSLTVLVVG